MITEPRWKSFIVQTTKPIFTPKQCQMIINAGRAEPRKDAEVGNDIGIKGGVIDTKTRTSHISWIPFSKRIEMYKDIEHVMKTTNGKYPEGGFYDWHVDNDVNFQHEPPVRKISMTLLLSPENEFEGGDLELMSEGKVAKIKQGHAIFFASFIRHRVKPVIRGNRKSLVMWFGGTPFK